jgi:hypothetical protein
MTFAAAAAGAGAGADHDQEVSVMTTYDVAVEELKPVTKATSDPRITAAADPVTCGFVSESWCPRGDLNPHAR